MTELVHVFVYNDAHLTGVESRAVRSDHVQGTLFDVEGIGPALMLAGYSKVPGQVRLVGADAVAAIDRTTRVADGLFRRIGVNVGDSACWVWVAGPRLAQRLASARATSKRTTKRTT